MSILDSALKFCEDINLSSLSCSIVLPSLIKKEWADNVDS
jgi:hypothetical protein